jgi:DNA polymerase-3 subunit gamma/tau
VGEPDIPLPPEPTDAEAWPYPAPPAEAAAAAARLEQPRPAATATPRAAAESSPAPRGSEPMPVVTANPPEAAGDGELDAGDVRRVWPELLKTVRGQKRTTEALLRSAQVQDLTNGSLTLAATSPALAKMLGDDLNKDIVRQALQELLGVRWKVQVVVAGAGQPASGRTASPEAAREAARAAEAAEASELMAERAAEGAGGDREPEPAVDPEQAALSLLRTHLGARPID